MDGHIASELAYCVYWWTITHGSKSTLYNTESSLVEFLNEESFPKVTLFNTEKKAHSIHQNENLTITVGHYSMKRKCTVYIYKFFKLIDIPGALPTKREHLCTWVCIVVKNRAKHELFNHQNLQGFDKFFHKIDWRGGTSILTANTITNA